MKVESINVGIPEKKAASTANNGGKEIDFSQFLSALMAGIVPLSNNVDAESLTDAKTSGDKLLNLDAMAPACKDAENLSELSKIANSSLKVDGQDLAEILNSIEEQAKNIEPEKLPDNELNNELSKLLDNDAQLNDESGKLTDNIQSDEKTIKDNLKQMIDILVKNEGQDNSSKKEDLNLNLKIDNGKVKPEMLNEEKEFNNKFIKIDDGPRLKEKVIMAVNAETPQAKIQENEMSLPNIEEDKNTAFIKKPSDLVDLAVTKFKALRLPEYTELRVKLKPESLGEITVKLVLEKGHISGSILANRPEVAETLQNSADDIIDKLKENNIFLNNLSVNVNSDNHNQSNERQFERFKGNRSKKEIKSFEEMVESQTNDEFNIIA